MHASDDARALHALTLVPGLGPVRIARLIGVCGGAPGALTASLSQLRRVEGIGDKTAASIVESRAKADELVADECETLASLGARLVTILDDAYPALLKSIPAAPPVLRVRGELGDAPGVAIVGSRSCTIYGTEQTARFASTLAAAGIPVVSGGARGIDAAAHHAAIKAGGRTIVVQGCGLAHTYPSEHEGLYDTVVERGGAVLSELPVHAPPSAENFPARNRIISGLSLGVVVIEAGHRSGALITARHAVEDHAREVFGVPGRVDSPSSRGTNDLLKSGAHLVTEPGEVIEILERSSRGIASRPEPRSESLHPKPEPTPIGDLSETAARLLGALDEPRTGDELAQTLGMTPAQIRAEATMLEIQGRLVRQGSRFARAR